MRITPLDVRGHRFAVKMRGYDKENHQLIGTLVSAQAKLAHASPDEFRSITPWITKAINLSESADEALAELAAQGRGAQKKVADVNSKAMDLLKEFQREILARHVGER